MDKQQQQLKIAMLGHKRIPSREGGVEIVVEELATRMVELGHEVTCFNRKGHHVSGEDFDIATTGKTYKGIRIKTVFTIDRKGLAAMTSSLAAALRCALGKYDVVHFHAEGPCAMIWIPRLFGKRCVATIHGLDWQRSKWGGCATKYIKFGEKMAVKYADEIIVLSEGVKAYFMETYHRETKFISNGVNKPEIKEAKIIQEKYGLQKDSYILYLGRLVPEKGLKYLIEAYKELKTEKKLVIAGGTSDTNGFLQEVQVLAKDDERILFTGFVQGQELDELYSNAYIYTLPSDLEGMPLSLLEAMSYGNCCMVSDIKECTEVVEDKAVVFKKSNVTELRKKLQGLCDCEAIVQEYKEKAEGYICRKYNWDDVVVKTVEGYQEVKSSENLNGKQVPIS